MYSPFASRRTECSPQSSLRRAGLEVSPIARALALATVVVCTPVSVRAQSVPAAEDIRGRLETMQESGSTVIADEPLASGDMIAAAYERRDFAPAWTSATAVNAMFRAIAGSVRDGLLPRDYHDSTLIAMRERLTSDTSASLRADFDVLLTDALARLAYHMAFGKVDPESLTPTWNLSRQLPGLDPIEWLDRAMGADSVDRIIERLAPQQRYYVALREALARYRQIDSAGGWPMIGEGPTLRVGSEGARVVRVRRHLVVTGDMPPSTVGDSLTFDSALSAAVSRYQLRNGLAIDGAVGPGTRRALDVPAGERIQQMRINLERGRWVLHDLPARFVAVNIAGYQAYYAADSEIVWSTRAQVGEAFRRTPIFKSMMTYLVFNPTWTVPRRIAVTEYLPAVKRDPRYLVSRNFDVLDRNGKVVPPTSIDWSRYTASNFPYDLRQRPGTDNALGQVKFMFPNQFAVYLHDTPAKTLFDRPDRNFSHGCIRIQFPLTLARLVLNDSVAWNDAAIQRVVAAAKMRTVTLASPLPVLLLYWTAYETTEGVVHFTPDAYRRDPPLLAALDGPFRVRGRPLAATTR